MSPDESALAARATAAAGDIVDISDTEIRGLDRETVRSLSQRSDSRGLAQLAAHLALLAAAGWLVWLARGSVWLLVAIPLYGVVLNVLFCALHESIHRTPFATRWLNDAVAWLCGALLLLPPEYFRQFHYAHHRYTQDPRRDPELAQPSPDRLGIYLWRATGIPNWRKRLTITLRHALTGRVPEPFITAERRPGIVREARILWTVYLSVFVVSLMWRSSAGLLFWIVPLVIGQPFLRLFLMAEHTGCPLSDEMFENTRTTYTNRAVRLLVWQMSYHVEHHAFPSVPFHALANVNALVRPRIAIAAPGYVAVHKGLIAGYRNDRPRPAGGGLAGVAEQDRIC